MDINSRGEAYSSTTKYWIQLGSDIVGDSGDWSGYSVSLSTDGIIVAIGAIWHDVNHGNDPYSNEGRTRIYRYSSTYNRWDKFGQDIVGESGDRDGYSVSLSSDGFIVAIGSTQHDVGKGRTRIYKYIYSNTPTPWTQLGSDIDGEPGDVSSNSVSLSAYGTIVAIGAYYHGNYKGRTRIYQYDGSTWNKLGQDLVGDPYDWSGSSVSLSADGTIVAIGAYNHDVGSSSQEGRTRIYQYSSDTSTWTQLGQNLVGDPGDWSGTSVSLNADGTILAIGAYSHDVDPATSVTSNEGRTRIYQLNENFIPNVNVNGDFRLDNGSNRTFTIQKKSRVHGFYYNATVLGLHNMEIDTTNIAGAGNLGEGYLSLKSDGSNVGSAGIISEHPGYIYFCTYNVAGSTTQIKQINEISRMTITSTGNIGIGTTDPKSSLHVAGGRATTPTTKGIHIGMNGPDLDAAIELVSDTDYNSYIDFSDVSTTTSHSGRILYQNSSNYMAFSTNATERMRIDSSGHFRLLYRNDGSVNNNFLTFERSSGDDCRINHYCYNQVSAQIDFNGYSSIPQGTIRFNTKPDGGTLDTRMTINYNGNVGIGTTNPTAALLHIEGMSGANPATGGHGFLNSGGAGSSGTNVYNQTLSLHCSGTVHASLFRAFSDERIKNNFQDLNDYEYLQKIKQLKPYTYNYIDKMSRTTETVTGFKAQEVKDIIPGSVGISKNYIPNIYKKCSIISKTPNAIITINNISTYSLSVENKLTLYEYFPDTTLEATKQSLNIKSINGINITLDGYLTTSNTTIWIRNIGECNVNTQGNENTDAIIITPTNISSNLSIGDTFEIYESQPNEKEKQHQLEITNIDGENVTLNGSLTTTINEIFVYGKEIDDFHNLSNDRITPVCVAGIQEIDRRVVSHFTGSHTCYPENNTIDYTNYIGLIVVSNGSYKIKRNSVTNTGKDAIKIDQATPQIKLSTADNQKSVMGVVSLVQDDTVLINSSGEGGIWVCNKNGNLENGDYISSSSVVGYGQKQILQEGTLKNYTVAKITCDVDFNSTNNFETRFLQADGTQITEEEYNTKKTEEEEVYLACFVGCTYHCG